MFTSMKDSTRDDWAHIAAEHKRHQQDAAATQIMGALRGSSRSKSASA